MDVISKFLFVFAFFILIAISGPENILADHGSSGGGGGCSGDCTPPTLGRDDYGQVFVTNGLAINGDNFEVSHFKQDMLPQILETGEPVTISLKVYENTGPSFLTHVFLKLGLEEKTISGVKVPSHSVQIIWERPLNEKPYVTVDDPNNFVSHVGVDSNLGTDAFGNEDALTEVIFEFTPTQKFDTDVVLVEMWDFKNNSWINYFYNSMKIDDSKSKFSEDVMSSESVDSEPKNSDMVLKIMLNSGAQNQIDDDTFKVGIQYLIEQKIMNIPNLQKFQFEPALHFIDVEKRCTILPGSILW